MAGMAWGICIVSVRFAKTLRPSRRPRTPPVLPLQRQWSTGAPETGGATETRQPPAPPFLHGAAVEARATLTFRWQTSRTFEMNGPGPQALPRDLRETDDSLT